MRWLYHLLPRGTVLADRYAPPSLAAEGFVHCSFRDAVRESARAHFPADAPLDVLRIDPRRLDVRLDVAATPRGPMPHIHGAVPRDAVVEVLSLAAIDAAPDRVTGTHFGFVAFEGMTLLDLVGVLDPVGRIASMGFDPTSRVSIVSAGPGPAWRCEGAILGADWVRPPLDDLDVLVVPGGLGTRRWVDDREVTGWLASFPHNRLAVSVCTGALLLGAAGRLRGLRATTHPTAMAELPKYGAVPTEARIVDEGQIITAGGVTCALDLGMLLVRRFAGDVAAEKIAVQMCLPAAFRAAAG